MGNKTQSIAHMLPPKMFFFLNKSTDIKTENKKRLGKKCQI